MSLSFVMPSNTSGMNVAHMGHQQQCIHAFQRVSHESHFPFLALVSFLFLKREQGFRKCFAHLCKDLSAAKIVIAAIGSAFEGLPVFGRKDFLQGDVELLLVCLGDTLYPHIDRGLVFR